VVRGRAEWRVGLEAIAHALEASILAACDQQLDGRRQNSCVNILLKTKAV
jgi:hypothetical protein